MIMTAKKFKLFKIEKLNKKWHTPIAKWPTSRHGTLPYLLTGNTLKQAPMNNIAPMREVPRFGEIMPVSPLSAAILLKMRLE